MIYECKTDKQRHLLSRAHKQTKTINKIDALISKHQKTRQSFVDRPIDRLMKDILDMQPGLLAVQDEMVESLLKSVINAKNLRIAEHKETVNELRSLFSNHDSPLLNVLFPLAPAEPNYDLCKQNFKGKIL